MMDTLKKLRDEQKIGPKLHSLSFKSLAIPCYLPESTLRYSPTLDLVALVTHPSALEVHRLNGEKVFEVKVAGGGMFDAAEVYAVAWRTDGEFFFLCFGDLISRQKIELSALSLRERSCQILAKTGDLGNKNMPWLLTMNILKALMAVENFG